MNEIIKKIKIELFGSEESGQATDDGFLIKLKKKQFDKDQFERIYSNLTELNTYLVSKNEEAAMFMAFYTEFTKCLFEYIDESEDENLKEIKNDLVGIFGK